jgi:Ca2+-binding EF-hand superfamily protein
MRTLLSLILISFTVHAFAAEKPATTAANAGDNWNALRCLADKDKNDKLSQQELDAYRPVPVRQLSKNFTEIDGNKDGVITLQEYSAYMQKDRAAWEALFKGMDADKSGGLSQAELAKAPSGQLVQIKRRFNDMDADKNGEVSIEERDRFIEQSQQEGPARSSGTAKGTKEGKKKTEAKPTATAAPAPKK